MKNLTYKKIIIIACLISILFGVFLHFAYTMSYKNNIVGLFAPVNESVWEHMKLIFIPFSLFGVIFYIYTKNKFSNTLLNTVLGNVVGMFTSVVIFYLFNNIFNIHSMVIDILSYILGIFVSYYIFYLGIYDEVYLNETKDSNILGACTLCLMFSLFILYTFAPIKLGIFRDPVTKTYGIENRLNV